MAICNCLCPLHLPLEIELDSVGEAVKLPMKKGFGQTDRSDPWWKGPVAMASYLGIMIIYATWRGFMEADFWIFSEFGYSAGVGHGAGTMAIENTGSHVLSPLYSPLIIPGKDTIGSMVPVALAWMSPAMFILIFPAGFRGTCYYYRKAYYRAFSSSPLAVQFPNHGTSIRVKLVY